MNEVCAKEFGAVLSFRDGGQGPASWWPHGEWIGGRRRDVEVQERRKGMGFSRLCIIASKHALTLHRHPWHSQQLTVPKVFSTVEQFEIIRTLQNVFKHAGNGYKKTLVKYNQLLAADQLSSWIAGWGERRSNNKPLD